MKSYRICAPTCSATFSAGRRSWRRAGLSPGHSPSQVTPCRCDRLASRSPTHKFLLPERRGESVLKDDRRPRARSAGADLASVQGQPCARTSPSKGGERNSSWRRKLRDHPGEFCAANGYRHVAQDNKLVVVVDSAEQPKTSRKPTAAASGSAMTKTSTWSSRMRTTVAVAITDGTLSVAIILTHGTRGPGKTA